MNIAEVRKLSPLEQWTYWISERESIRRKRALGIEKPWTDDEILQSYRFCNVRRMDDKVSEWLLKNWYTPFRNRPNALKACALARFFNNPATLRAITHLVFDSVWRPREIIDAVRRLKEGGNTIFNGAYMVRGNDGIDKIECVTMFYVDPLDEKMLDRGSMETTWSRILPSYGMGSFMAGQIVADLRHAVSGQWRDKLSWAPMGPGSKRGMNRVLGRPITTPMNQEEFLNNLRLFIGVAQSNLPQDLTKRLEAQDFQSTFCETDKYLRILNGEGKPKQKYQGA